MAQRIMGDAARAMVCSVIGVLAGAGVAVPAAARAGAEVDRTLALLVPGYLVAWSVFVILYLAWTHVVYSRRSPAFVGSLVRRQKKAGRRRWARWLGIDAGAADWTLTAAMVAVVMTFVIALNPTFRAETLYIAGGLLTVGCSWALMAYSFAMEYQRLDIDPQDDGQRHITHALEGPMRFGDYLTMTILLSVMGATTSAEPNSRAAWTTVRVNVVFAFAFNSVIVAMVVSLLFGGIAG